MEILGYYIPESLENNNFINSLYNKQINQKPFSERQKLALFNMLDIEIEYPNLNLNAEIHIDFQEMFEKLKNKYLTTNFRKAKTKNNCIFALQSIINDNPDYKIIEKVFGDYNPYNRYRRW